MGADQVITILRVSFVFLLSQGAVANSQRCEHLDSCNAEHNHFELHEEEAALLQTTLRTGERSVESMDAAALLAQNDAEEKGKFENDERLLANSTTTAAPKVGKNSAAGVVGVALNSPGDLKTFISGLILHTILITCGFCAFSCLRRRYPLMYRYKELLSYEQGETDLYGGYKPEKPIADYCETPRRSRIEQFFGWIPASFALTLNDFEYSANLDHAMLMEWLHCMMKILALMAIPMLCILAPIQACCGGMAAGKDYLSYIGIGNVTPNKYGWIYYIHGVTVYYVMFVVNFMIYHTHKTKFLPRRFRWLRAMPAPRSNTILVEHIPPEHRSDEKLKKYFNDLFQDPHAKTYLGKQTVEEAVVVKHTQELCKAISTLEASKDDRKAKEFKWEKEGKKPDEEPDFKQMDADIAKQIIEIDAMRIDILQQAKTEGSKVYAENGFVTFKKRSTKEMAVAQTYCEDDDDMIVSIPPAPEDVIYGDLQTGEIVAAGEALIGYGLIVGVFFGFMPIVIGISTLTNLNNLESSMPWLKSILTSLSFIKAPLEAVLASAGLTLFMDFLPTILMCIFQGFFVLVAETWAQVRLQVYYFWFQVVFTVLVTAVGGSLVNTMAYIAEHPTALFSLIGDSLPSATHFYLNFMVMQWFTQVLNLTRWFYFIKFKIFGWFYETEDAKFKAEPEAQDYYGMGGRGARFACNMVIGIVFSNLSPGIIVLVFINFVLCRLIYGYLFVFAEIRKSDLGGVFWFTSARHVMMATVLYWIVMVGLLFQRGVGWGEGIMTIPAILIFIIFWHKIHHTLQWETLPFEEICNEETSAQTKRKSARNTYQQPELESIAK